MNELINNLRLDAGISRLKDDSRLVVIDREGNVINPLIGLEKFAELILQECTNIAYEYDGLKMSGPGMIIAERIKEHFGVE